MPVVVVPALASGRLTGHAFRHSAARSTQRLRATPLQRTVHSHTVRGELHTRSEMTTRRRAAALEARREAQIASAYTTWLHGLSPVCVHWLSDLLGVAETSSKFRLNRNFTCVASWCSSGVQALGSLSRSTRAPCSADRRENRPVWR